MREIRFWLTSDGREEKRRRVHELCIPAVYAFNRERGLVTRWIMWLISKVLGTRFGFLQRRLPNLCATLAQLLHGVAAVCLPTLITPLFYLNPTDQFSRVLENLYDSWIVTDLLFKIRRVARHSRFNPFVTLVLFYFFSLAEPRVCQYRNQHSRASRAAPTVYAYVIFTRDKKKRDV